MTRLGGGLRSRLVRMASGQVRMPFHCQLYPLVELV